MFSGSRLWAEGPVQKDYCGVVSGDTPTRKGGRQTGQREKLHCGCERGLS